MKEIVCGNCGTKLLVPHGHKIGLESIIDHSPQLKTYLEKEGQSENDFDVYRRISKLIGQWLKQDFENKFGCKIYETKTPI